MTDDARRTRSKPRERRAQNRPPTRANKQAATQVRAQQVAKRRRRKVEDVVAERAFRRRHAPRVRGRSSLKSRKPERAGRGR
jgi:hypothetical protein